MLKATGRGYPLRVNIFRADRNAPMLAAPRRLSRPPLPGLAGGKKISGVAKGGRPVSCGVPFSDCFWPGGVRVRRACGSPPAFHLAPLNSLAVGLVAPFVHPDLLWWFRPKLALLASLFVC